MALHGSSVMYGALSNSSTGSGNATKWQNRINAIWKQSTSSFFPNNQILSETACESNTPVNCNIDQLSFKSSFSRFLAMSTKLAPFLYDQVAPYLAASAKAAAATCTGQPGGDSCGTLWTTGSFDGATGLGQEMSALQIIQANLIKNRPMPVTNGTGGTSIGDPSAGSQATQPLFTYAPLTTGDKAGAGILTAIVLILTIATVWFACH